METIDIINLNEIFKEKGLTSKAVMQIHDDLMIECTKTEMAEVKDILNKYTHSKFRNYAISNQQLNN